MGLFRHADPQTPCHYCDVKPLHSEHSREETMVSYRKLYDEVVVCVEKLLLHFYK